MMTAAVKMAGTEPSLRYCIHKVSEEPLAPEDDTPLAVGTRVEVDTMGTPEDTSLVEDTSTVPDTVVASSFVAAAAAVPMSPERSRDVCPNPQMQVPEESND